MKNLFIYFILFVSLQASFLSAAEVSRKSQMTDEVKASSLKGAKTNQDNIAKDDSVSFDNKYNKYLSLKVNAFIMGEADKPFGITMDLIFLNSNLEMGFGVDLSHNQIVNKAEYQELNLTDSVDELMLKPYFISKYRIDVSSDSSASPYLKIGFVRDFDNIEYNNFVDDPNNSDSRYLINYDTSFDPMWFLALGFEYLYKDRLSLGIEFNTVATRVDNSSGSYFEQYNTTILTSSYHNIEYIYDSKVIISIGFILY